MNPYERKIALALPYAGILKTDKDGIELVGTKYLGKDPSLYKFDIDFRKCRQSEPWGLAQIALQGEIQRLMADHLLRFGNLAGWDHIAHVPECDQLVPHADVLRDVYGVQLRRGLIWGEKKPGPELAFEIQEPARVRGRTFAIIEDAMTTGYSTKVFIEYLHSLGARCTHVLTFIDREDGGREAMETLGVRMNRVFTSYRLFGLWLEHDVLHGFAKQVASAETNALMI